MAYLNVKERVIETKIVYYGAGLSGKTTNLEQIKKLSTDGRCGDIMSLDTDGDRTLFFDWLPFNIGKFNGCDVKMQLYTVPGQQRYSETRKKVLAAADGVILVLDSQSGAIEKNKQILADLRDHMSANGLKPENVPVVVQLNKRDLPTAMSVDDIMTAVGIVGWPRVEAVAASGQGVFETLREASRLVLQAMREGVRTKSNEIQTGASSGLDGASLYTSLVEAGYAPGVSGPPQAETGTHAVTVRPAPVPPGARATTVVEGRANATPVAASAVSPTNGAPVVQAGRAAPQAKPAPPPPAGTVDGSSTQLNEVIAGHRSIVRRLDALEQAVQHGIASSMADVERRLVARVGEAVERSVRLLLDARVSSLEAVTNAAAESVSARLAAMEQQAAELKASMATSSDLKAAREAVEARVREVPTKASFDALQAHVDKRTTELRSGQLALPVVEKVVAAACGALAEEARVRAEAHERRTDVALSEQKAALSSIRDLCEVTTAIVTPLEKRLDERTGRVEVRLRESIEKIGELYGALDQNVKSVEETLSAIVEEQRQAKKGWFR